MTAKNGHAGRPRLPVGEKRTKHTITLTPRDHELLSQAGLGNLSAGVALACGVYRKHPGKKPCPPTSGGG